MSKKKLPEPKLPKYAYAVVDNETGVVRDIYMRRRGTKNGPGAGSNYEVFVGDARVVRIKVSKEPKKRK